MQTLQQKIDAIAENNQLNHYLPNTKPELDKALQEFREEIDKLKTHRYKAGDDWFVGISYFRVMQLIGEQTNA